MRARLLPAYVEIWHERELVARHERSFERYRQVLDLEHYLDVLERKPGALAGSRPLQQWREKRALAAEFRPIVAESGTSRGQAGWYANHDRVVTARQQAWLGTIAASHRASAGYWAARTRRRCGICWSSENWGMRRWRVSRWTDWSATSVRCR